MLIASNKFRAQIRILEARIMKIAECNETFIVQQSLHSESGFRFADSLDTGADMS